MHLNKTDSMRGIVTVLNTPFTSSGDIDPPSLRKNVQRAISCGIAGFLVPAMASEANCLSEQEREQLVCTVLEETAGRVPVIGGASANSREERIRIAGKMNDIGCDGVLVNVPYRDDTQYEYEVRDLAALKPGFLMLQDWDFSGYGIPTDLVVRLFEEIEVFSCFKVEVVPAGSKYTELMEKTGGGLHISGGWAVMQFIEALDRGVHAFMPTGMHEIYTRIFSLYQKGRRKEAEELFHKVLPVLAFSNQHLDISLHFFKRLLYREGVYASPLVRKQTIPFDDFHKCIADELIDRVQRITEELTALHDDESADKGY